MLLQANKWQENKSRKQKAPHRRVPFLLPKTIADKFYFSRCGFVLAQSFQPQKHKTLNHDQTQG